MCMQSSENQVSNAAFSTKMTIRAVLWKWREIVFTLLESHPCFEVGTATRRRTIIKHLAHPPLSTLEREILTRKNSKDGNDNDGLVSKYS